MGKITSYATLTNIATDDLALVVDVHDTSMAATGTDKQITLGNLLTSGGLQFLTGGGTITTTTISNAQAANYQGIFLDPRFVWDMSGLVLHGVSNFIIESKMVGSIGYGGNVSYNATGYVKTDTGSPADGIQIYCNVGAPEATQGLILRGLSLVGNNSNAVLHLGGGQRRIFVEECFIRNTNSTMQGATVSAGAGTAINATNFSGTQTLTVNSTTGYVNGVGVIFLQCLAGSVVTIAAFSYNGTTSTTFNNCKLISVYTGATLSTTAGSNKVMAPCMAMSDDTGLAAYNSEDQTFTHVSMVSDNGIAMGLNVSNIAFKDNDTIWNDCATISGGFCSLAALGGGGHNFYNYYDRTKASQGPTVATVWNDSSTLIFRGGEDQNNNATGVAHLVDSGSTVIDSRNFTQAGTPGNVVTAQILGGKLLFTGVCTANNGSGQASANTINVAAGVLDLSGPSLNPANFRVTGAGGTVMLSASYGTSTPPNLLTYTGTVVYPHGPGLQGNTSLTGYTLINGTGTILTWTSPNDGQMHRVSVISSKHTTAAETGGSVQVTYTLPDGTGATASAFAGGAAIGTASSTIDRAVAPNTTVTLQQNTALTAGTSTVQAQIWGA